MSYLLLLLLLPFFMLKRKSVLPPVTGADAIFRARGQKFPASSRCCHFSCEREKMSYLLQLLLMPFFLLQGEDVPPPRAAASFRVKRKGRRNGGQNALRKTCIAAKKSLFLGIS